MGGAQRVLHGVLERTKGLVAGVTCGAGMPYKLSEIAASYGVNYLPIISSARAFRALWKRAYPRRPSGWRRWSTRIPGWPAAITACPTPRTRCGRRIPIRASRRCARRCARAAFPTTCRSSWPAASGTCSEWEHWIDNPELGQIVFQFGTRPLLTKESPIPEGWKQRLMTLEEGDILLHRFSPTGFYSSAVRNPFLRNLEARSHRQIAFTKEALGDHASSSTSASAARRISG